MDESWRIGDIGLLDPDFRENEGLISRARRVVNKMNTEQLI